MLQDKLRVRILICLVAYCGVHPLSQNLIVSLVSFNDASNYSWVYDDCMKASLTTSGSTSSSGGSSTSSSGSSSSSSSGGSSSSLPVSSNWYYPNWLGTGMCVNDGAQPSYMNKAPELWMYKTIKECCKERFNWAFDDCVKG